MNETAEAAPHPTIDTYADKKLVLTASPMFNFINENCKKCSFLDRCEPNQQLRCILARISLDLHSLNRTNFLRGRHLDW